MSTLLNEAPHSTEVDIAHQLDFRIQADVQAFNGKMPERYALAWHAYLTGLSEWKVIDFVSYQKLIDLLPRVAEPNPLITISLGHEE